MVWRWLLIFLITYTSVHSQERDSIYLFNGQVLIGNIKNAQLGALTIDDRDLRFVTIKMYKIKTINAAHRFKIETHEKELIYGILKRGSKDGWVKIHLDDGEIREMPILDLNEIIALEKKFFTRIDGNFSLGFSYTKSKDLGQLNLSSYARYIGEKTEYQLSISSISSIDSGVFSRDRGNADLFAGYNLSATWLVAAGIEYERNLELSISRRFQEFIGGGNKVILKKDLQLVILSGITFNQERSTSGTESGLLLELPITTRFNFYKYRKPNLQVSFFQTFYFGLTQKERRRYDANLNFSYELVKDFYITLNPYASYDNQPPEGDITFDYGTAFSITYKF